MKGNVAAGGFSSVPRSEHTYTTIPYYTVLYYKLSNMLLNRCRPFLLPDVRDLDETPLFLEEGTHKFQRMSSVSAVMGL